MAFRMDYGGGPPHRWKSWIQRHLERLRAGVAGDGGDSPNAGLDPGAIGEGPGAPLASPPAAGPGGPGDSAGATGAGRESPNWRCVQGNFADDARRADGQPNALVALRRARRRALAAVARGGHGPGWIKYWIRRYPYLSGLAAALAALALALPGGGVPPAGPVPGSGLLMLQDTAPPRQADVRPLRLPDGVTLVTREGLRLAPDGTAVPGGAVRAGAGFYYLGTGPETPVLPVVRPTGDGRGLLDRREARLRAAGALGDLAISRRYAGYHLEFGPLAAEPGFPALADAVADRLHRQGRTLALSLWPDQAPAALAGRLSRQADLVVLQAHRPRPFAAAPEPVAPLDWVERQLQAALAGARPDRVVLGVGAYGYDWSDGAAGIRRLTLAQVRELVRRHGAVPAEGSDGAHFTYVDGGTRHQVWYESPASAAAKARLARVYGLRGVAVWSPGGDGGAGPGDAAGEFWQQLAAAWRAG